MAPPDAVQPQQVQQKGVAKHRKGGDGRLAAGYKKSKQTVGNTQEERIRVFAQSQKEAEANRLRNQSQEGEAENGLNADLKTDENPAGQQMRYARGGMALMIGPTTTEHYEREREKHARSVSKRSSGSRKKDKH